MTVRFIPAAVVGALLFVCTGAMATGPYHPTPNEAGASYHPDHLGSKKQAEVAAELNSAMRHPAWGPALSRGAPWPVTNAGAPKTRAQVSAELQAAMKHPAWSNVSRGAPWPTVMADAK